MNYPFYCPKCGHREEINMKMSKYTSTGHKCRECGEEMQREISSMTFGMMQDKTNTFYKKTTF